MTRSCTAVVRETNCCTGRAALVRGVPAALISAVLLAACHPPLEWHWLAWVALVPWLVALPRLRSDHAWLLGVVLGLAWYRLGLAWVFGLSGPLAGSGLVVLSIWLGLAFRVAKLLMERFGRGAMLWAVPLAFAGQEVLRCEGLPRLRFPFLALGYTQSPNLWIAQLASVGGVYFLTFVIVAVNAAIAYALVERRARAWLAPGLMVGALAVAGVLVQPAPLAPATLPVACVQAEDVGPLRLMELTREAFAHQSRPRLVVLPEHTIDDNVGRTHPLVSGLGRIAADHGGWICVGAHLEPAPGSACDFDNVALLIGPQGEVVGHQAKSVPLPFFMDGNPAGEQAPLAMQGHGMLGLLVCYDALFTDHARRLVRAGAELLVVPVMDPARWPEQERLQHAAMAPIRSIELRRWAVRAASSGVSQIIDPNGRVGAMRAKAAGPGVLHASVAFRSGQTLFANGGWVFGCAVGVLFLLLIAALTVVDWRERWRSRRPADRSSCEDAV